MIQGTINKAQAAKLFAVNAVLFGQANGMPERTATELFGADAVAFAKRQENTGIAFNGYGIGDYTAEYLTEYGFYIAATYHNVKRLEALERKNDSETGR